VKAVAESFEVREALGMKWVKNPVSGFYYELRADKDKFSTINQSTGAYIFDLWLLLYLQMRPQVTAQTHDDFQTEIKLGYRKQQTEMINKAIDKVNKMLNLNVDIEIDINFGQNYSETH
jgi:hypothetical protein